jgi:hypothetical protein
VIWFFERNADLLICEIRQSADGPAYEFEVSPSDGPPETMRFTSPRELITEYLRKQSQLQAQGWRPRLGDIAALAE